MTLDRFDAMVAFLMEERQPLLPTLPGHVHLCADRDDDPIADDWDGERSLQAPGGWSEQVQGVEAGNHRVPHA